MNKTDPYIVPISYWLLRKAPEGWYFRLGEIVTRAERGPAATIDPNEREKLFGLTKKQIVYECFKVKVGALGWYIADLKNRNYYYCGTEQEQARAKMIELTQIGISHPQGL